MSFAGIGKLLGYVHSHGRAACLIVGLSSFLETALLLGLFLPTEKIIWAGCILAAQGSISKVCFLVSSSVGTFAGYTVSYFLGKLLGHERLKHLLTKVKIGEDKFYKTKDFLNKRGELALIFGRFIAVIKAIIPVVFGAFEADFKNFMIYNALGAVIWAFGMLLSGYAVKGLFLYALNHKILAVGLFAIMLSVLWIWRRKWKG